MTVRPHLANISIDLDGIGCYHAIHRLDADADATAIYDVALPRFLRCVEAHGARATLFVITSDLAHPGVADALRDAVARGHEVASHSHRHFYDLRHRDDATLAAELDDAADALEHHIGVRPVGFRTPGYNLDDRLLAALVERGYRYDSSVFACPPYYLAKGAVMAAMAAMRRPSGSSMTHPGALIAPLQPYRPSARSFARPGRGRHRLPIWEFPMGVVRGLRVPVIGTSVGALSPRAARRLAEALLWRQPITQLEFHGIDFMDAQDDAISDALARRQPDVRRPWRTKQRAFDALFETVGRARRWTTLAELCDALDAA
jgi:hypothetical protein